MMKSWHLIPGLAIALSACGQGTFEAMPDFAGTGSQEGSPVSSAIYSGINGPVGWTFQTTTDVSVTALGAFGYVIPTGGLEVGIWNASGTLLASQSVGSGGTTVGQSLYESISPVLLTPGQTYYIAAWSSRFVLNAIAVTPNTSPNGYATMSPDIQLGLVAYGAGGGFSFPGTTDGYVGCAIIAPNFEFQAVPEPAVGWLAAAGVAGFICIRRRAG
jgi:hypothetical protein